MSTYRIARKLSVSPRVLEGFVGVEASSDRPVIVKRLVPPWAKEGPTFGGHFAFRAQACRGAPGLPEWVEVGLGRGSVWMAEALHEGESLRHVVSALAKERSFLAPNEGLAVVAKVASLLAKLHARPTPIVHGDVCGSTVLLLANGGVLLSDACVTPLLPPSSATGPARAEGFALAPEQFTGESTTATDVFRLGLLLYELSVGQPLFYALDAVQTLVSCQRFMGVSREAVRQVPEPWQSLLIDTLAVEPRDRPSAEEVQSALLKASVKAGWKSPADDIARLFARACANRTSLESLARGGTQELVLVPIAPVEPVAPKVVSAPVEEVEDKQSATNTFSKLPPVPASEVIAQVSSGPPVLQPVPTPSPSAPSGPLPPLTPVGAVVGRISTRKMTRGELEAARTSDAEAKSTQTSQSHPRVEAPTGPFDARIGDVLVEKNLITRAQLTEALQQAQALNTTLVEALTSLSLCDEDVLVVAVADFTHTPHTTSEKLAAMSVPAEALARVPLELAKELDLVPLGLKGGTQLMVAMKDPMNSRSLERLKAATGLKGVVAVRAGENAIRRTRSRFYLGKEDDTPDWLERGGGGSSGSGVFAPMVKGLETVPVVSGQLMPADAWELRGAPPLGAVVPVSTTLDSPAGRLVTSLLTVLGERGTHARQLATFTVAIAGRLGVEGAELEQLRFAATALMVANFIDGRPAHDVPTVASLSAVLGDELWTELEPMLTPWLDWPSANAGSLAAQALCVSFGFAAHAGFPRPTGSRLGGALVSFKARFKVEAVLLDALGREVGLS